MKEKNNYILDTSAVFCLKDDGEGADRVEEILEKTKRKECEVFISFMTLMEYLYICLIRYGEDVGRQAYLQLSLLPIVVVESDEDLRVIAAELKANYNISVADAWIAATAIKNKAILVHKDPEYEALTKTIECLKLPYKTA